MNPAGDVAYYWPARDLVTEGLCTPQCLIAADEDGLAWADCRCRCNGVLHGALAEIVVVRRSLVEEFADGAAAEGNPDPMAALIARGGDPRAMTRAEQELAEAESLVTALEKRSAADPRRELGDQELMRFARLRVETLRRREAAQP